MKGCSKELSTCIIDALNSQKDKAKKKLFDEQLFWFLTISLLLIIVVISAVKSTTTATSITATTATGRIGLGSSFIYYEGLT
jgi:hypothetical protein